MSEPLTIKRATRQGVKPLIGLFAESGCGKTMSALLLARGFVGPDGKVVLVDSESGRGNLYADVIPGGYETLQLDEPFSPSRYVEAVKAVEESGARMGILDSVSHEWEGLGGVLDMATENEKQSRKPGLHNWRQPKMEHSKFLLRLLQSPIPWILCMRAKHKTRQTRNGQGKTEIVKDEFTTPIQADGFIFEMTCHAEIMQDHSLRITKSGHPDLKKCFPDAGPACVEHGEKIAKWCEAGPTGPAIATERTRSWMIAKLLDMKAQAEQYAIDNGIIMPNQGLADWPLSEVVTTPAELTALRNKILRHQ